MDRARDLIDGELLVLARSTERVQDGILKQDAEVELHTVRDDHGRSVLPAFTSEEALNRWARSGAPFLGLPARTVFDLLASEATPWDCMVVNARSPDEFAVTAVEARELLGL